MTDLEDVRHYPECGLSTRALTRHSTLGKNLNLHDEPIFVKSWDEENVTELEPQCLPSGIQGQIKAIDIMILSLILTRSTKMCAKRICILTLAVS